MSRLLLAALLVLASASPAQARPVQLGGQIGDLSGDGWAAQDVSWSLSLSTPSLLKIARVDIEQFPFALSEIVLTCNGWQLNNGVWQCPEGAVQAKMGADLIVGQWQGEGSSQGVIGDMSLTFPGVGKVTTFLDAEGQIQIVADEISVSGLVKYLPGFVPENLLGLDATVTAQMQVNWPEDPDRKMNAGPAVNAEFAVTGLSFDSTDGTLAGADLELSGSAAIALERSGRRVFSASAAIHAGELLVDPAYVSFSETPDLQLDLDGFRAADGTIAIETWQLTDADSIEASGDVVVAPGGQLNHVRIDLKQLALGKAWPRYLSAIADGQGFSSVSAEGAMQAHLQITDGELEHFSTVLDRVTLSTDDGRYAIRTLDGVVDYSAAGDSADSTVQWESVEYYTLVVGSTSSRFFAGGGQLQLLEPVFLPVLDGGLQIDELVVDSSPDGQKAVDFRGELKPMALDQITRALGWPELQGTLGGSIPQVRLRGQVVEVGGGVVIDVFGGQVTMNQLKLERIFGVLPTLAADVEIANIDLEQMTGAFSFGKIEGVLMGQVKGLRLLDWRPVAFDLDLHTRRESGRRQRISQRAVDNLSSIGGGVAALGSSVLKIFDDFGYKELGLSCVLRNNTCTMGGVGDAGNGYYLVRGSGLPRIDIKGFSRRVDWPQLVRRLQAATESGPVSVE
ncbi:MAG: hypothetical protein AB8B96_20800 [Lysobacterales bacterium]